MEKLTYGKYLEDPSAVLAQVERGARRERAEAIDYFVLAPLMRFMTCRLAAFLQPRTA